MTSRWNFRFSKKHPSLNGAAIRIVFARTPAFAGILKDAFLQPVRGRLEAKLKKAADKKPEANGLPDSSDYVVPFTEGGQLRLVVLPEELTHFEVLGALRRHAASAFKNDDAEALEFDLTVLDASTQAFVLSALAELSGLVGFKPVAYGKGAEKKDKTKDAKARDVTIATSVAPAKAESLVEAGQRLAVANNFVRELAEMPGNELTPKTYRKKLESYAKDAKGVSLKYMDVSALKKLNAGAFLAVVKADPDTESGIAHLVHKGKGKKKLILVGKGLCFDTGGYNIKTGSYMNGMHEDMTGSAVAWALFELFRKLRPDWEIHAFLAIAENLISATAFRPNDVVIACDGTAIEVVDTDAEGRMVLADTLALAAREGGDLILDFATLTGAAFRAVDTRRNAVFSNRADLASRAVSVGDGCGELAWDFPLSRDYRRGLKSEIADILQCASVPNADHIYAATFLRHFVGEKTPWVHCDLSSHKTKGGLGLVDTATTGSGVRWAYHFAEDVLG